MDGAKARAALGVMVELLSCFQSLSVDAPLMTYVREDDVPLWWTQGQATKAPRALVAKPGIDPQEYTLQSLQIGGGTQFSAGGASLDIAQKEGRWTWDTYKLYVRKNSDSTQRASGAVENAPVRGEKQPGEGVVWSWPWFYRWTRRRK